MALNLPPDPYLALGVSKDAKLPEIRSAHRKLVLKCHPDKVQDATLKAEKQDEFQKVQQAYEILSDDTRRLQYDEQVKLFELRKEMGRGVATPRSNPFEFEVRSAEPRTTSYPTRSRGQPAPKIYTTHSPPKTYDIPKTYEDIYDKPLRSTKKSSSYDSSERKRDEERQRELRKREDDDKEKQKLEREKRRTAHGDRKKTRDKEKRRETDEKRTRTRPYVEDISDDELPPPPREKKSSRDKQRLEEELRMRNDSPRVSASPRLGTVPLTPKWDGHKDSALEYMQAARSKVPDDGFRQPPLRRGETFGGTDTAYSVRYTTAPKASLSLSDDDTPRRSSFRRRASEAPPSRSRETTRKEKESTKRSSSTRKTYTEDVGPPSPPPVLKMPKFKTHTSAPPLSPDSLKPVRSKTEYPRKDKESSVSSPPTRAHTFQSVDSHRERDRDHGRDREGSKLKNPILYGSPGSDTDDHIFVSPRGSRSPPRPPRTSRSPPRPQRVSSPRRREAPEQTHYKIREGSAVPKTPTTRHRTVMRDIDDEDYSPRDRSVSPRGSRKTERPPISGGGSRQTPQRSQSQSHYPSPVDPMAVPIRPKQSRDHGSSGSRGSPLFAEVTEPQYTPVYRDEDVRYSPHAGVDPYRRGSEPTHRSSYPSPRTRGGEVYATG